MVLTKKEVGLQIKKARNVKSEIINQKYTQQMLAEDLKISRGYLGDIENGRTYPNYVLLSKIAEICGVTVEFLTSSNPLDENTLNYLIKEKEDIYSVQTDIEQDYKPHLDDGICKEELTEDETNALKAYLTLYRQQKH